MSRGLTTRIVTYGGDQGISQGDGEYAPFTPPGNGAAYRDKFVGKYEHRVFKVGHNVPQEAPGAFAQAVVDADRL
jgi:pimeloyl-ACP methyl ester carboxylesterase